MNAQPSMPVQRHELGGDVLHAFEATARENPDRVAIRRDGNELIYAHLQGLAQDVARVLGPRPGVVGVGATRSPETIAALLGVWSAGGAYCPVDPSFPWRRRQAMLAAAGCRVVLDPGTQRVQTLTGRSAIDGEPDDVAYVLFTSGSTGEPKPVLTPRAAIAASVRSLRELFGITRSDRVLQFASLNWDTCFEEILPALTSGACLVLHDDAHSGSFPRFLRMIESEQITVLDLPTAYWHELVNHLREDAAPLPDCVRLVIIGGEAVSPARLADWCALKTGHARLLNTYGCTETTLITHAIDLHGPMASHPGVDWMSEPAVPIGWPLPHVVERVGDDGELLIAGPGLALGYRGLPQATDQKFIIDAGCRFFRTGDRVSRRPDGSLRYEGRIDAEVKIRGVRVDPAEVEAHIAGLPWVSAAAVVGVKVGDHTVLAAYIVPGALAGPTDLANRVFDHLRRRVPSHLIPSRIHIVDELAYTASGKVDRRRIVEHDQATRNRVVERSMIEETH